MPKLESYKNRINQAIGRRSLLEKQYGAATASIKDLELRTVSIAEAQALIQQTAVETQMGVIMHIEDISNKVINTVFPDISFKLEFDIKRNRSEANLRFFKGTNEINILGDSGGVLNVATLALRFAVWSLSSTANVLLLDESFSNLSQDLQPRIGEVISELSHELGLQIILISHSPQVDAYADKVFKIAQPDGMISEVV